MLGVELTASEVRVLELQSRSGGEMPVVWNPMYGRAGQRA